MTYLEKYMQEHPDAERDLVVRNECPGDDYTTTSVKCLALRAVGSGEFACRNCWNQEIPETEKIEEPKKCIGLSYEEKQKLLRFVLELSDEERDHLLRMLRKRKMG